MQAGAFLGDGRLRHNSPTEPENWDRVLWQGGGVLEQVYINLLYEFLTHSAKGQRIGKANNGHTTRPIQLRCEELFSRLMGLPDHTGSPVSSGGSL